MSNTNISDHDINSTERYEYRVTGCAADGWRRTEWGTRKQAVKDCKNARENWGGMVGLERRVPGDNKTIQRCPGPNSSEWMDVTNDKIHFADEEVQLA